MASIVFSLSRRIVNNRAEVLCRLYHGSLNQRAHTGIYAPVQVWNTKEGRCTISKRFESPLNAEARQVQNELDALAAHIYNTYTSVRVHSATFLKDCIAEYYQPEQNNIPLADCIESYCTSRNVMPQTRARMFVLRNMLNQYARKHPPLTAALTKQDLDTFFAFLIQGGRSENTARSRLRQLRTLLYFVGKPNPNPFDNYRIPQDAYGTPIYLTKDERDFVAMYSDLTSDQKVQRDIFIFQCLTGCRIDDLLHLTPRNIQGGWLCYTPAKISRANPVAVEIPLTEQALEIVERYKGIDKRGRLLPFISKQGYNKMIHRILKACACNRVVMVYNPLTHETTPTPLWQAATSHTARKTFTQLLYAATGDKRLVATLTGHSENSQAFNRYSEVNRDIKQAAVLKAL